jgi:hypothetical protein
MLIPTSGKHCSHVSRSRFGTQAPSILIMRPNEGQILQARDELVKRNVDFTDRMSGNDKVVRKAKMFFPETRRILHPERWLSF